MGTNALVALIATIGAGLSLFGIYVSRGGLQQLRMGRKRLRPQLVLGHMVLGFAALGVWIAYLVSDDESLAWLTLGALVVVTVLGSISYYIWQRRRLGVLKATRDRWDVPRTALGSGSMPAEQYFPVSVVVLHGLFAVGTIVLVVLTLHEARGFFADASLAGGAGVPLEQRATARPRGVVGRRDGRRVEVAFRAGSRRAVVRLLAEPEAPGSLRRTVVGTRPSEVERVRMRASRRARYATVTSLGPTGARSLTVRVPLR